MWIAFFAGIFIGFWIGIVTAAFLMMAGNYERHMPGIDDVELNHDYGKAHD